MQIVRKMTIDELLEAWARWRALREDNGLGYATSRLGVLMGGGAVSGTGNSSLPYGLDVGSIGAKMDSAICRLNKRGQQVILLEYCRVGLQAAKAAGMRPPMAVKTYRNQLVFAKNKLTADGRVKKLSKGD